MKTAFDRQRGFAMPAMFLFVAIAFVGSLGVKTSDGTTVAARMGIDLSQQTEFSALEAAPSDAPEATNGLTLEE
jgi:hypothetical protein